MTTQTDYHLATVGQQILESVSAQDFRHVIHPDTLASLDLRLLETLRKIGLSRERICSALCISYEDFDSLHELAAD